MIGVSTPYLYELEPGVLAAVVMWGYSRGPSHPVRHPWMTDAHKAYFNSKSERDSFSEWIQSR